MDDRILLRGRMFLEPLLAGDLGGFTLGGVRDEPKAIGVEGTMERIQRGVVARGFAGNERARAELGAQGFPALASGALFAGVPSQRANPSNSPAHPQSSTLPRSITLYHKKTAGPLTEPDGYSSFAERTRLFFSNPFRPSRHHRDHEDRRPVRPPSQAFR